MARLAELSDESGRDDESGGIGTIVSLDVRDVPDGRDGCLVSSTRPEIYVGPKIGELLRAHRVDTVIHLAAVVTPGPQHTRQVLYSIDVDGTANVIEACLQAGCASSGGHQQRRCIWLSRRTTRFLLDEKDALRGNAEFAYSDHKRLVEEMLARHRTEHPAARAADPASWHHPGRGGRQPDHRSSSTSRVVLGVSGIGPRPSSSSGIAMSSSVWLPGCNGWAYGHLQPGR